MTQLQRFTGAQVVKSDQFPAVVAGLLRLVSHVHKLVVIRHEFVNTRELHLKNNAFSVCITDLHKMSKQATRFQEENLCQQHNTGLSVELSMI